MESRSTKRRLQVQLMSMHSSTFGMIEMESLCVVGGWVLWVAVTKCGPLIMATIPRRI